MLRAVKKHPDWMERGKPLTLSFPLRGDDAKTYVAPGSGTFTLYTPDGETAKDIDGVLISAKSIVLQLVDPRSGQPTSDGSIGVMAATVALTLPADATLGHRWLEQWDLVVGGVAQPPYKHEAAVVLQMIYPVIGESDLTAGRHRNLEHVLQDSEHGTLSDYIDAAWDEVVIELIKDGRYPFKVLSSWAFRLHHIYRSLYLLFFDAATNQPNARAGESSYVRVANEYGNLLELEWKGIVATFDNDQDGLPGPQDAGQVVYRSSLASSGIENRLLNPNESPMDIQKQWQTAGSQGITFVNGVAVQGNYTPGRGW